MSEEKEVLEYGKGISRIHTLGCDVLALIAKDKKESLSDILEQFQNGDIVRYLIDKYENELFYIMKESTYNYDDWNNLFKEQTKDLTEHDVKKGTGFDNDDGLLYVVSVIFRVIATKIGL